MARTSGTLDADVRARRPWLVVAVALLPLVLLWPTGAWSACPAGAADPTGGCVDRTLTLVGLELPSAAHLPVLVLSCLVLAVVTWVVVTRLGRRQAARAR